jgi:hypothetical protein
LYVFSCLSKHAESFVASVLPEAIGPVEHCLKSRGEEPVIAAARFVSSVLNNYGQEALDFATRIAPALLNKLDRSGNREHLKASLFQAIIETGKILGDRDLIAHIVGLVISDFPRYTDLALQSTCHLAKLVNDSQLIELVNVVIDTIQHTHGQDTAEFCFRALGKLIRAATPISIPHIFPQSAELFQSLISGAIPAFTGKSISDLALDFSPEFLDALSPFVSALISVKTDLADSIATVILPLTARESPVYHAFTLEILIDAISADTVSPAIVQALLDAVPRLISLAGDASQQSISFLLNVLLRRDPHFFESVAPLMQLLLQWWSTSARRPMTHANLASLFLQIAVIQSDALPPDALLESIDAFPPTDRMETAPMAENILALAARGAFGTAAFPRVALALASLFTEPTRSFRKMRLSSETNASLVALFRALCSNAETARVVFATFASMSAKSERLSSLLT